MHHPKLFPWVLLVGALCSVGTSVGCGEPCKLVSQGVTITKVDPQLAVPVDTCLAEQNMKWDRDAGPREIPLSSDASTDAGTLAQTWLFLPTVSPTSPPPPPRPKTPKSCLQVCRHVLTLVETFPGDQTLIDCMVSTGNIADPAAVHVAISYRPPC
ncbi:MAG: hypothetical protein SGI86_08205 [Deltaproteobacteria bacterium]|nr:hypothetical protein [Deltaproteobacteria bacterium]